MSNMYKIQDAFDQLNRENIGGSLVSIKVRPTASTMPELADRQKHTQNVALNAIRGEQLSQLNQESEGLRYIYMITIRSKDLSKWKLASSFNKYLALRDLQLIAKAKDSNGKLVDVQNEPYVNQNNKSETLVTFYVTNKTDVIGGDTIVS